MKPFFFGKIENGKIVITRKDIFKEYVSKIGEGQEIQLTIGKRHWTRSTSENSYYWAVIVQMVADHVGWIPDDAHAYMAKLFLKKGIEFKGKREVVVRSTTSLTVPEFEKYCENCRMWAANELGVVIPMPNEILEEN